MKNLQIHILNHIKLLSTRKTDAKKEKYSTIEIGNGKKWFSRLNNMQIIGIIILYS